MREPVRPAPISKNLQPFSFQSAATQEPVGDTIPTRKFGKHDVRVSILGFGGHHLGDAENEAVAVRLVQEAVDNGITFFDNCWEYR